MEKRDVGIAYLLLLTFGVWGAHRYYVGRKGSAAAMTTITALIVPISLLAMMAGGVQGILFGVVAWLVIGVWWVVDLFLTAGMVQEFNNSVQARRATIATGTDRMTTPSDPPGGFIPKHDPRAWAENAVVQGRHRA